MVSFTKHKILPVVLLLSLLVSLSSAGLKLKFPFPFLSFHNPLRPPKLPLLKNSPTNQNIQNHQNQKQHSALDLNHLHTDQKGSLYQHDPESIVKFYYKENNNGPFNRVDIHHDGCRQVPMDYWYNRPKSVWAKHCITLYQSGDCKGEGIQVAGMVSELRTAGMHYGVNSFKPCESNIRIRFMPSAENKKVSHL